VLVAAASTVGAATVINAAVVSFIQLLPKEYSFSRQTVAVSMCSGKLRGVSKAGEIDLLLPLHSLWYANN
jgi:hypothetical protein